MLFEVVNAGEPAESSMVYVPLAAHWARETPVMAARAARPNTRRAQTLDGQVMVGKKRDGCFPPKIKHEMWPKNGATGGKQANAQAPPTTHTQPKADVTHHCGVDGA